MTESDLSSTQESKSLMKFDSMKNPICLNFEPVGRWYEAHCLHRQRQQTLSSHSLDTASSNEEADVDIESENDDFLFALDPTDWKNQDHYAVLGLATLRSSATSEQIKRAYRRKVLKHHPDKRKSRGIHVKEGDDDYFTCITRAYEIIGTPLKRRSFDSIDPQFDNSIPPKDVTADKFYTTFKTVFDRNSKWSVKTKVPKLGDDTSSYDDVCHFYSFWYEFDSWREYSYLDEEEKEKGENREERRWIEKQNKAARSKLKKEEVARIRQLVDNAYACDPRILRFKEEEKEKKMAQKRAKQEAIRIKQEEEERVKRELEDAEKQKKQQAEAEAKAQAALQKKKNDERKKLLKKERKAFRSYASDFSFFAKDGEQKTNHVNEVEKLAENLSLENLQNLNVILSTAEQSAACEAFDKQLSEYNAEKEREKQAMLDSLQKRSEDTNCGSASNKKAWTDEETHCLIKGVNVFPAGTQDRWEVIANFIKQHISGSTHTAREVLSKAKDLQKNDASLKVKASQKAFEIFEKEKKSASVASAPSQRVETIADQQIRETGSNPGVWLPEEQKLLEQALKTFPASVADRWDKIAEVVSTRSKKDCIRRYKELAELIKAKKAAQEATRAKKT